LTGWSKKRRRGRTYPFIHIVLAAGNSASEVRKLDTFIERSDRRSTSAPVRDALLTLGLAQEHRWGPNSGWITFQARSEVDVSDALWLMRLSYLRYALKTASDPRRMLDQSSDELQLSARFKSVLEPFIPRSTAA
jgi:luciferase-like monooxygenase